MPQVKVGWRSGSVAAPSVSTMLLDVYSGAAVAYSLRKLKSSYTGSVIRVRRSSDNTELNIGFDSDGNLDTYALSAFVGTGNGFVTTWYDQSGNGRDATQTTAGNQPKIVINGVLNTLGTKAAINFDGSGDSLNSPYTQGSTNEMYLVTQTSDTYFVYPTNGLSTYGYVAQNGSTSTALYSNYGTPQLFTNGVLRTPVNRGDVYNILNGYKLVTHKNFSMSVWPSGYPTIIGVYSGSADYNGNVQEWLIYPTLQSSQSSIESNINSYYSVYPNPTSVWNLLAAAYNADATGSSSLKTSLVASYNGESNANDSKGTNNGTAQGGLTYTTGKIGDAFQFNGTNAYVSLSNSSGQFNFTGDFTISTWINIPNYTKHLALFENYVNGGTYGYGYSFNLQTNNKFQLLLRNGNVASQYVSISGIPTASWNHIVVVRKVGQAAKFYLNGTLISGNYALGNSSMSPVYSGSNPCTMGFVTYGTTANYSNHRQDATTIWNKELTQSEITELYNSGNGAQYIGDNFYKPTTNDALGTNNGTAQGGLTYGLGKVGTAFQFNGSNAYVSLPNNSLNFTGDFSVSLWLYRQPLAGGMLVSNWYNGSTPYGWYIYNTNGVIQFLVGNGTSSPVCSFNSSLLTSNVWNFVTVTKTATSAKIYINGVLNTSATLSSSVVYTTTHYPMIGAAKYDTGSPTFLSQNGDKIDEVNIWNRVLTSTEVTELYNSGNGKQYPN